MTLRATDASEPSNWSQSSILFFVILAVFGVIFAIFVPKNGPEPPSLIFFGLVLCESGVVAAWSALRPGSWPPRIIFLAVASSFLGIKLGLGIGEFDIWPVAIGTGSCLVCAALLAAWRTVTKSTLVVGQENPDQDEALQFSIRQIMYLTVAIAALCAVGRAVRPFMTGPSELESIPIIGGSAALIGVVCSWAFLGTSSVLIRIVVSVITCIAVSWLAGIALKFPAASGVLWAQTGWLSICLVVLRWMGYRLLRTNSG